MPDDDNPRTSGKLSKQGVLMIWPVNSKVPFYISMLIMTFQLKFFKIFQKIKQNMKVFQKIMNM